MVYCFAFGCNHRTKGKNECQLFRFPTDQKKLKKWVDLCRTADRKYVPNDRICSCHFVGGLKENGPTIFSYSKGYAFYDPEPSKRKRKLEPPVEAVQEVSEPVELHQRPQHVEHGYAHPCYTEDCAVRAKKMEERMSGLENEISALEKKLEDISVKKRRMTLSDIFSNPEKMLLYTSVSAEVFQILLDVIKFCGPLKYYAGWKVVSLSTEDQLLMTLMKLRLNCRDLDLAHRFDVSRATVSNIIQTHIHALHEILYDGVMVARGIPSQLKCKGSMPKSFDEFGAAPIAIDATEITQDIPSDLLRQSMAYSHYKSRHTVKAVTGVAPNGALVFCSDLYLGSTSDNQIVEHCNLISHFEPGDLVLADKGFTLYEQMPSGVFLNIPPFLSTKTHFSKEEAAACYSLGRSRIHVERANERIKNYEILNHIRAQYRLLGTKIFQLCTCLVNLQAALLKEVADAFTEAM